MALRSETAKAIREAPERATVGSCDLLRLNALAWIWTRWRWLKGDREDQYRTEQRRWEEDSDADEDVSLEAFAAHAGYQDRAATQAESAAAQDTLASRFIEAALGSSSALTVRVATSLGDIEKRLPVTGVFAPYRCTHQGVKRKANGVAGLAGTTAHSEQEEAVTTVRSAAVGIDPRKLTAAFPERGRRLRNYIDACYVRNDGLEPSQQRRSERHWRRP
eukprot:2724383-Prymnesium_polylepis.1